MQDLHQNCFGYRSPERPLDTSWMDIVRRIYLKDRINNGNKDFRIVEFDLFHLMVEILQEEGYLEAFFDLEKENGFFEMADSLVETLGLDETNLL